MKFFVTYKDNNFADGKSRLEDLQVEGVKFHTLTDDEFDELDDYSPMDRRFYFTQTVGNSATDGGVATINSVEDLKKLTDALTSDGKADDCFISFKDAPLECDGYIIANNHLPNSYADQNEIIEALLIDDSAKDTKRVDFDLKSYSHEDKVRKFLGVKSNSPEAYCVVYGTIGNKRYSFFYSDENKMHRPTVVDCDGKVYLRGNVLVTNNETNYLSDEDIASIKKAITRDSEDNLVLKLDNKRGNDLYAVNDDDNLPF